MRKKKRFGKLLPITLSRESVTEKVSKNGSKKATRETYKLEIPAIIVFVIVATAIVLNPETALAFANALKNFGFSLMDLRGSIH